VGTATPVINLAASIPRERDRYADPASFRSVVPKFRQQRGAIVAIYEFRCTVQPVFVEPTSLCNSTPAGSSRLGAPRNQIPQP
jgi:hypothetical protein